MVSQRRNRYRFLRNRLLISQFLHRVHCSTVTRVVVTLLHEFLLTYFLLGVTTKMKPGGIVRARHGSQLGSFQHDILQESESLNNSRFCRGVIALSPTKRLSVVGERPDTARLLVDEIRPIRMARGTPSLGIGRAGEMMYVSSNRHGPR